MKPYHFIILSKNRSSIDKFLTFFQNNIEPNFNVVKKNFQQKKRKKKLTLLKSPHVNKTAQEQFEYRIFSKQISMYLDKHLKSLVLLKKLKTDLFPDVKIKVIFPINHSNTEKLRTNILNPNNFKGNFYGNIKCKNDKSISIEKTRNDVTSLVQKSQKILRVIDVFGELLLSKK